MVPRGSLAAVPSTKAEFHRRALLRAFLIFTQCFPIVSVQVLFALLARVPPTQEACLSGYHRYRIKDHVFPAIRPCEGSSVRGLIMPGLDAREKVGTAAAGVGAEQSK